MSVMTGHPRTAVRATLTHLLLLTSALSLCVWGAPAARGHEDIELQIAGISEQLQVRPGDPELLCRRGRLFLEHENLTEALADFDRSLEVAPGRLEPLIYRGLALHQLGQTERALQDLDRYVAEGPPDYMAYEVRARIRSSLDDVMGAVEDLTDAIRLRPLPEHFSQRARLLKRAGLATEAIANYEEGIRLLGESVPIVMGLLELEAEEGRFEEALRWLAVLEDQSPRRERWMLKRAEILARAAQESASQAAYAEALAELDRRIAAGRSTHFVLLEKAQALAGLGRHDEARELLRSLGPAAQEMEEYHVLQQLLGEAR